MRRLLIALIIALSLFSLTVSAGAADKGQEGVSPGNATEDVRPPSPDAVKTEPYSTITRGPSKDYTYKDFIAQQRPGYVILPYKSGRAADEELMEIWSTVKKTLKDKDMKATEAALIELQGRCLDFGITSFEDLSASIIKEGMLHLGSGNKDVALRLFDAAANISPNYPPVYYAKGWGIFSQNKLKFLVALDSFIEGASKAGEDFWWSIYFIGNKLSSVLFTLAALFSMFGLFMAIRYTPLLAHDLAERLDKAEQETKFRYIIVPFVYLAILLLLGYWWAVVAVFLTLWLYFNKREKALSIIFFVLIVAMPTVMTYYASFIRASGDKTLWVMDEVNKGRIETGSEKVIRELIEKEPQNEVARMALAQMLSKERRYADSVEQYSILVKQAPDSAIYRNNLGNVYLLMGKMNAALDEYKAATQYDAGSAIPYFNMGQAYGEKLMFTEREEAKKKASELDPNLTEQLSRRSGVTPLRFIFDESIPQKLFWDIALKDSPETDILADSIWSTMIKVMPLSGMPYAGIGMIILLFAVNAFRKKGVYSHFCEKCGKVSCIKCQRPHYSKDLCVQCYLAFVKMEGVEAKDRVRKTIEIREKHARDMLLYRISSLIIPGSGHFLAGRPLRGFVICGLFIFAIKDILYGSFIKSPYGVSLSIFGPDVIIAGSLLALVYLFSQADIYRLTRRGNK